MKAENPGKAKNGSNGYTFSIPGRGTLLLPRPTSPGQEHRMGFQDFDGDYHVDGAAKPSLSFSLIQWINQDRKQRDPQNLSSTGGFFSEDEFPGSRPVFFVTDKGNEIHGFGCATLEFAILAKRQRWITNGDGIFPSFFEARDRLPENRAKDGKSHTQIAIRIPGDDQIRILGLKGMAGESVNLWIKNLEAIAASATRYARKKDPKKAPLAPYMFGAVYQVGAAKVVGKEPNQKTIFPPAQVLPVNPDLKALVDLWVGAEKSAEFGHWIVDVGREWIGQWQYAIGNGTVAAAGQAPAGNNEPPPPDDGDAPPSRW